MDLDWTQPDLAEGLRLYETGKFFEAHEHWEDVWRLSPQPQKTFLQSLIQVAGAFHHLQRNNPKGATGLMRSALRRLEPCPDHFAGISVTALRQEIRLWLRALEQNDPARPHVPVQIRPQL